MTGVATRLGLAVIAVAAAALTAGCPGLVKHSTRNPHGNVDLVAPTRLTMDPTQEVPEDPGEHRVGIAPGIVATPGLGRMGGNGAFELGVQLHLSFADAESSGGRDAMGYPMKAWGATLGWGIAQFGFGDGTGGTDTPTVMGPLQLGVTYHTLYAFGGSAGLVLYPTPGKVGDGSEGGVDPGAQLTIQAGVFTGRVRYVRDSGFEIFGGYVLELPASLTWSR